MHLQILINTRMVERVKRNIAASKQHTSVQTIPAYQLLQVNFCFKSEFNEPYNLSYHLGGSHGINQE